jgi:hypothetical protein
MGPGFGLWLFAVSLAARAAKMRNVYKRRGSGGFGRSSKTARRMPQPFRSARPAVAPTRPGRVAGEA